MKFYLAMCSLSLAAGAALGHFNGQYLAAANFVDDCEDSRFVVFHDREADENRHFHCFEIKTQSPEERREPAPSVHTPVI